MAFKLAYLKMRKHVFTWLISVEIGKLEISSSVYDVIKNFINLIRKNPAHVSFSWELKKGDVPKLCAIFLAQLVVSVK